MRISISIIASDVQVSQDFIPLEVFPDMSLDNVKGFVEAEINVAPAIQHFILNNQPVTNTTQNLTQLGISEGDVLSLVIQSGQQRDRNRAPPAQNVRNPSGQPGQSGRTGDPDTETLRLQVLGDARALARLRGTKPELADAINDPRRFAEIWNEHQRQVEDQQREKEQTLALLDSDPFNPEAQAKIEEIIRQERVQENMYKAMDENPESFGRVVMLYIDVLVNNIPIKAFVDSGAQTTIMSPDAAERCGIMRLIDRRFGGVARGVGTATILGRVHSADIQIGQYSLASSFTVMEGKDVDLLLGLDMLKRHQMVIDLRDNCLRIQDDQVPFLSENEIPKMMEEILEKEPKVDGPGGTKIGATTGTVASTSAEASVSASASSAPSGTDRPPRGATGRPENVPRGAVTASNEPQQQSASSLGFGQVAPVTERSISQITELGFSREEAVAALQQAEGNVELAIGLLL